MNHDFDTLAARAAPAMFVVLWSTGFIATKYVVHNADPLTYLAIRMALVVGVMAFIAGIARPRWPDRIGIAHSLIAGILVHGFYLGGTAIAIAHTIPAGLSALIPGLQPILTSTIASRWFGERVTPLQWAGLVVGLAGVVLILHSRPMSGEAGWGWLACLAAVSTVGAIALFFAGLRRVGPTTASLVSTVEPVVTVGLACAVFGESLGPLQLAGGGLVLGAVLMVQT